jgi:phage baseplate assembly protein W
VNHVDFPWHVDLRGRTAEPPDEDAHVRDLIEQVLFTTPGERVNRPDFGSGLMQMVFQPNSDELAAATGFLVRNALEHWLGDLVAVEGVEVEAVESRLRVTVRYVVRRTEAQATAQFTRGLAP